MSRDSNPEPPVAAAIEPPIVPRVSGDYSSSTYGSAKSGHYRNITVRESIASLRARNALPTFLSENRRPVEVVIHFLLSLFYRELKCSFN